MSSLIENLNKIDDNNENDINVNEINNNLYENILDLSLDINIRINCINLYYKNKEDITEIITILINMYNFNGIKMLENYLYKICTKSNIPSIYKIKIANSMLEFREEEIFTDDDEYTKQYNLKIKEKNKVRNQFGFEVLNYVCQNFNNVPSPCRIKCIYKLLSNEKYKNNANKYFTNFIEDQSIDVLFRYKNIVCLEFFIINKLKTEFLILFSDKNFVKNIYVKFDKLIKKEFPKFKPAIDNYDFFEFIINRLNYDKCVEIYISLFPERDCNKLLYNFQNIFLSNELNNIYYRILSAQYLLQKFKLDEKIKISVENKLLTFSEDESIEYNRRADAVDTLLYLGSEDNKIKARKILIKLGKIDGKINTVFNNAQNVHTEEIEESVLKIIKFLKEIKNDENKNFNSIKNYIKNTIEEEKNSIKSMNIKEQKLCNYCENIIKEEVFEKDNIFCSKNCSNMFIRRKNINLSLERIFLDRRLYSGKSLSEILSKLWLYIFKNKNKDEMYKRLLEELKDMADTCSSGYISRLVNSICGFGDFNIQISLRDQIISNFSGRLNAYARKITDKKSIYHTTKLYNVVELWLNSQDNKTKNDKNIKSIKKEIIDDLHDKNIKILSMKKIIDEFLKHNKQEKIDNCIENFSENVLNEITLNSSDFENRKNFSLFFSTYLSIIRKELYDEFKDLVDDDYFELSFRNAIFYYETGSK